MKFVYYWENKITGQWYIGSRTAAGCHINDGYICSSKIAKPLIMAKPDEWARTILFEHEDPKVVIAKETELLTEFDAAHDALALNRHNGGGKFSNVGNQHTDATRAKMSAAKRNVTAETREKIRTGNTGKIVSEESRAKMSAWQIGRKHTDETKKKMRAAATGKKHTDESRAKISASLLTESSYCGWYHPVHDTFYGTTRELVEKYELNRQSLDHVRSGRRPQYNGWVVNESYLPNIKFNEITKQWRYVQ